MELGVRIKQCRKGSGLSIKAAAEALEISEKTLSRYEKGEAEPTMTVLIMMLELYKVTTYELLGFNAPVDESLTGEALYNAYKVQAMDVLVEIEKQRIRAGREPYTDEYLDFMFLSVLEELLKKSSSIKDRKDVLYRFKGEYGNLISTQE